MPEPPAPTPKKRKPPAKAMREREEDPLRPAAKLGEEHQVFGAGCTSVASIRARAAAALLPKLVPSKSSFLVALLALDESELHPVGRAAEDHGDGWILPGEVRRPGEGDDREVGSLAGGERPGLVGEAERARRAKRSEFERLVRRERVRPLGPRARDVDRGAHLLEHVERGSRGGAVGAQADPHAGLEELSHGRDAAAEDGVRARAVGDGDVVARRGARSPRRRPSRSALPGRAARAGRASARWRTDVVPGGSTSLTAAIGPSPRSR